MYSIFNVNSSTNTASITGTPTICFKSLPIVLTAENSIGTVMKKVSFTVNGVKPAFVLPDINSTTTINAETDSNVSIKFEVTGTKNITFSMNKVSGFALTQTGENTATVTGITPSKAKKTTLKITAANATGKTAKTIVIQTTAKSSASKDSSSEELKSFEIETTSEAVMNIISNRTLSSLSKNLISQLES